MISRITEIATLTFTAPIAWKKHRRDKGKHRREKAEPNNAGNVKGGF